MHFIFVYFVHIRGKVCPNIKCILKHKSQNLQQSAAVRKFQAYKRPGVPTCENIVRTKYSGFRVPETLTGTNARTASLSVCVCVSQGKESARQARKRYRRYLKRSELEQTQHPEKDNNSTMCVVCVCVCVCACVSVCARVWPGIICSEQRYRFQEHFFSLYMLTL